MGNAHVIASLRFLGLVPLGDVTSEGVTLARDEGQYDAFRIRVRVPVRGKAQLKINGKLSDDPDPVDAVRQFLKVVRS